MGSIVKVSLRTGAGPAQDDKLVTPDWDRFASVAENVLDRDAGWARYRVVGELDAAVAR
jgi:hypothetical protein